MNKERANNSIKADRFLGLVKDVIASADGRAPADSANKASDHVPNPTEDSICPSSPTAPLTVEEKFAKVRHGLEAAIELYGQDRHVELGEYWPEFLELLVSFGCVNDSSVAEDEALQVKKAAEALAAGDAAAAAEEEALLAEKGEVAEDAEAKNPAPSPSAASAGSPKKRVITQADIDERAKMNAGRPRYLAPDDDFEAFEKSCTNPIAYLKRTVLYKESVQKCKEVKTILADVEIHDGNTNKGSEKDAGKWTPTSRIDSNGYGTYYRAIEGTPFHSLKVVGEVECNILSTLAVLCELDMYKEWFPMCWQSEEQGRIGDLHRWSQFTITCPWPVAHRSVFIGGFGCDCVNQKKIVIVANSVDAQNDYVPIECNIPAPQSRTVTAVLNCGGFVLEPMKGGKTKVSFTMNVDPKLKAVPTSLINWFSGKLIWVLLKNLGSAAKKAEKKGSPYHVRREEQKHLYDYFHQRALQVLPPDHL